MKRAFRRWLLRSLKPCSYMVALMSESMDRPLGLGEQLQLKLHLIVCTWCGRYLNQINFMRQLLRKELPNHTKPHKACKDPKVST